MPRLRSVVSLFFLVSLLSGIGAWAESARLECSLGFGSYTVPHRWIPLYVRSDKQLDSGRIEVRRMGVEGMPLSVETFPYRGSIRLECPVHMDEDCLSLNVALRSGGHTLAETSLNLWDKVFPGHIILYSGMPSAVQRSLSSILLPDEPVQIVAVRVQDLPSLALDYDGVSVIAVPDPGTSLSPSQVQALKAWVSGGGRLLLTGTRSGQRSLLSFFGSRFSADEARAFGSGRIAASRAEATELPRAGLDDAIHSAIGLEQYGEEPRLVSSAMFPRDLAPAVSGPNLSRPGSALAIGLILWAGAVSAIFFIRKRKLAYLLAISLAFALLAVPSGFLLDRSWRRGGIGSVRLLALPESSGFLADAGFCLPSAEIPSAPFGMMAWKLDLGFDVSEKGTIEPDAVPVWRHESWKSHFLLYSSGPGSIRLSAFLPQMIAEKSGIPALFDELALADGTPAPLKRVRQGPLVYYSAERDLWWKWEHLAWRWIGSGDCPPEFADQEEWLRLVASQSGGKGVFAGWDKFHAMRFSVQGSLLDNAIWARPAAAAAEAE